MGFVTPALIGGAALIVLPIALHLIMRRESKLLKFPALRFVQQRRQMNQHRLKLRQLLLLAMRCAIIALLALALARPTLRGSAGAGKEGAAVATALVFDNSLRMQYEQESQTRWQKSKELATWLVHQLPADSPVTIVDRGGRQHGQDLNRDGAKRESSGLNRARRFGQWTMCSTMPRGGWPLKRTFVVKCTCLPIWRPRRGRRPRQLSLRNLSTRLPGANVYLIDVGVLDPQERGLGALKLSSERVASTGNLRLDDRISA